MQDQWSNSVNQPVGDRSGSEQQVGEHPVGDQWVGDRWATPPLDAPPDPGIAPEPSDTRGRRRWPLLVLIAVAVLVVPLLVGGYFLTRTEPVKFAVGDCVSLTAQAPVEYGCTDSNAAYRIAAREAVTWPLASACVKHRNATKAVGDPGGATPEVVLCLAPTRFNMTDPGAIEAGDCIDVKGAGDTLTRVPCLPNNFGTKVLGTELHRQVPVTDRACQSQPQARAAFAQASLGGRAIVLCAVVNEPNSVRMAQVGDCTDENMGKLVPCNGPEASLRVLTVSMVYQRPTSPQCSSVRGARAFTMTDNDKTDLVLAICLGPADENSVGYAQVGACVTGGRGVMPRQVDCTDPAATHEVTERREVNDGKCPPAIHTWFTQGPGVTNGVTLCLSRR